MKIEIRYMFVCRLSISSSILVFCLFTKVLQ